MKDDYLWDMTGEPDPEIQQLEQVLGALRYQPRSLDIPAGIVPRHKQTFFPRLLAIAATIALMLLSVGLWFGWQRQQTTDGPRATNNPVTTGSPRETVAVRPTEGGAMAPLSAPGPDGKTLRHTGRREARSRRATQLMPEFTKQEREEAVAAKEQLMLALRVASSKLSFAQKKAQEINSENQIHNQHKVG